MTLTMAEWSTRLLSLADALSVPDGGFSVDTITGADMRAGYAVAVHPEHARILTHTVTAGDLIGYTARVAAALELPGRILGGWHDPTSGAVYLDVSVVTSRLSEALSLGIQYHQLAVFDLASMESVPVDVTVGAV